MTLIKVLFYLLGFIAIASALYVAGSKNLMRSIFMFFVTLFALAGLYVLSLADFVAVTQIVIYVGGILVLILFAFMLSGRETLNTIQDTENKLISLTKLPAIILAVLFFVVMVKVLYSTHPDSLNWIQQSVKSGNAIQPETKLIDNIGINLMTKYLLPFESISILLLLALVGAAHLSRKEQQA
ncbi:NADH-quinone oxidoreductase subunit J [Mucilaginibacter gynuensis]|uniref:NADH-quinone oxidoreductase subunit J n=1 Tax=Mucilaginibacter gynuensis TaxID=1302236 RepID=A0ABP8HC41_9SPHI